MSALDLPLFGNLILCAVLVASTYSIAISIAAGRGRPHLLPSAKLSAYAACALVMVAVFVLAYAFQAHDFRIRYVARYSDRSMPWWYLWASLWGGQDGSILWWTFLLSVYSTLCIRALKQKILALQPYIVATLMSVMVFFGVLMLFAANPFATVAAGAVPDGEGLNPLLQNYWMMIHPPMLYLGLVGWAVPFAFVMSALITGRLEDGWIAASRRWTLFAWIALAVGNTLGMLWSYEELGWGGYWAWDPVENAAFLPLMSATAYLHSVMLQERRGMFKVWNVFLLCLTFFMTIFGTFLTRSGMIASVHSFAKSSIGIYFVWYMAGLILVCGYLIIKRLPKLRAEHRIDSMLSRDFVFLLNNWILMGMLLFVVLATTFPLISEALRDETVTVGPGYYNKWMVPLGLILLALTGIGPLLAWRKSTGAHMMKVMMWPTIATLAMLVAHGLFGESAGFPAYVPGDDIYDTMTGRVLARIYGASPLISSTLCTFLFVGHLQEFARGTRMRMRNAKESALVALINLVARAKRRHGGYIVHMGLAAMFFGFTGSAYDEEKEAALRPGASMEVGGYSVRYDGSRMETAPGRRMVFSDMTVFKDGAEVAKIEPAKFIYQKPRGTTTTEVAIRSTPANDIYAIMNTVNPTTKLGTFRIIIRPFVMWIWIGGLLMILGTSISLSPSVREVLGELPKASRSGRNGRAASGGGSGMSTAAVTVVLMLGAAAMLFSTGIAQGQADSSSSLHAGSVSNMTPAERKLFERLLCECGDCQRLPLSTCTCGWAEKMRAELRGDLAGGATSAAVQKDYRERFGAQAIAIPADEGLDRALWAVPVIAIAMGLFGLLMMARRWVQRPAGSGRESQESSTSASDTKAPGEADVYDARLEEELARLDD